MTRPAKDLDKMAVTFGKIKEFMDVDDFTLGVTENNAAPNPPKYSILGQIITGA